MIVGIIQEFQRPTALCQQRSNAVRVDVHVVSMSPSIPVPGREGETADGMEHAQSGASLRGPSELLKSAHRVGEVGEQSGRQDSSNAAVSNRQLSDIAHNTSRNRLASQSDGFVEHGRGSVDAQHRAL